MTYYKTIYRSPIGDMSLVADDHALIGAWFIGQRYFERGLENEDLLMEKNTILEASISWLEAYFSWQKPTIPDFLVTKGTPFQTAVWHLLKTIPQGQTRSYGDLAKVLNSSSAQAVGGAVGKNPLSLFIPCHRVLGAQGQLTGYAAGIDKKIWLLEKEKG